MIVTIENMEIIGDLYYNGEIYPLYYDPEENTFTAEGGWIVYDLYTYMTPHELMIFKERKEDMILQNPRHGFLIGLFYPLGEDIDDSGTWEDYHEESS